MCAFKTFFKFSFSKFEFWESLALWSIDVPFRLVVGHLAVFRERREARQVEILVVFSSNLIKHLLFRVN